METCSFSKSFENRETRQLIDRNKNYTSENIILGSDHENYKPIEQMHTHGESSFISKKINTASTK